MLRAGTVDAEWRIGGPVIFLENTPERWSLQPGRRTGLPHLVNYSGDKRETGPRCRKSVLRLTSCARKFSYRSVVALRRTRRSRSSGATTGWFRRSLEVHSVYLIECWPEARAGSDLQASRGVTYL
jgi:hypothetical protein